ncbi:unnamed protein product [Arctia plantaginis]|uniref:Uncharacterized protein n=1 Tax=Arctia plantaginis TaxID=874455 RepID=A0A8S0ZBX4_ARCPL|nr:unnamed protein product [Arctia plantaginis]
MQLKDMGSSTDKRKAARIQAVRRIAQALNKELVARVCALKEESTTNATTVPAIYIVKYNRFVDNILEKMNDILRTSYDPVSVKLQPIDANKKTTKRKTTNKNKPKRKTSNKKKNSARGSAVTEKINESTVTEALEPAKEQKDQTNEIKPVEEIIEQTQESIAVETRANKDKTGIDKAKPTTIKTKPPTKATKPPTKVSKPPAKITKPKPSKTKTTTKKPSTNKNKTKTSEKSKPRAKGTLYGLSSLRRTGDVAVSIMSNYTSVKSNFAVGPLILRVQKEVGRGAKKDIRSATATTAEMVGKLTLRINNEGIASLHTIKVLQPKQVRVDSNNERTRELVWRRSARIAHVVSQKLLSASKPMFVKE